MPYSAAARRSIALLRAQIEKELPGIWFQPNVTGLTPFPRCAADFDSIESIIAKLRDQLEDVIIYRHADSFDITPCGITKQSGVERLCAMLGVTAQETAAVGDGVNDYPMFEFAGLALGVNVADVQKVGRSFGSVDDAMTYLLERQQA